MEILLCQIQWLDSFQNTEKTISFSSASSEATSENGHNYEFIKGQRINVSYWKQIY